MVPKIVILSNQRSGSTLLCSSLMKYIPDLKIDNPELFEMHKDNKRNGQGVITFANGDKYVGDFKADKQNGLGTYTTPDGRIFKGVFKNGEFISSN